MKLSIIIVSWNVRPYVIACLESLLRFAPPCDYEIFVVDNASFDGTVEAVRSQYPSVNVIANQTNAGFARANNQAAAKAAGDYLFILNPDTLFLSNTISPLLDFMDTHPDVAVCGPRVLNEDGSIQRSVRGEVSWRMAFARHTLLGKMGLFSELLRQWRCRDFDYSKQADVGVSIGAALLIRKNIYQRIGGFDERFFMYFEELDLCKRIREEGGRVVFYPGAEIVHLGGKSSKQIPAKKNFMYLNSLILYLQKYSSPTQSRILTVLFRLGVVVDQLGEGVFYCLKSLAYKLFGNSVRSSQYAARYKSAIEFVCRYAFVFLRGKDSNVKYGK